VISACAQFPEVGGEAGARICLHVESISVICAHRLAGKLFNAAIFSINDNAHRPKYGSEISVFAFLWYLCNLKDCRSRSTRRTDAEHMMQGIGFMAPASGKQMKKHKKTLYR